MSPCYRQWLLTCNNNKWQAVNPCDQAEVRDSLGAGHRAVLLIDLSHSALVLLASIRQRMHARTPARIRHHMRASSSSREILLLISVSEGPFAPEDRAEPSAAQLCDFSSWGYLLRSRTSKWNNDPPFFRSVPRLGYVVTPMLALFSGRLTKVPIASSPVLTLWRHQADVASTVAGSEHRNTPFGPCCQLWHD